MHALPAPASKVKKPAQRAAASVSTRSRSVGGCVPNRKEAEPTTRQSFLSSSSFFFFLLRIFLAAGDSAKPPEIDCAGDRTRQARSGSPPAPGLALGCGFGCWATAGDGRRVARARDSGCASFYCCRPANLKGYPSQNVPAAGSFYGVGVPACLLRTPYSVHISDGRPVGSPGMRVPLVYGVRRICLRAPRSMHVHARYRCTP